MKADDGRLTTDDIIYPIEIHGQQTTSNCVRINRAEVGETPISVIV